MRRRKGIGHFLALACWDVGLAFVLIYCCRVNDISYFLVLPIVTGAIFGVGFLLLLYLLAPWVASLVGLVIVVLNAIFLHILWVWGMGGFVTRFHALFEATPDEMSGYLQLLLHEPTTWVIVLYVLVSAGLLFIAVWKHTDLKLVERKVRNAAYLIVALFVGLPLVLRIPFMYPALETAWGLYKAYIDLQSIKQRRLWLATHTVPQLKCDQYYDKIVIVIGESANRDFMSLYSYRKAKTTPFLDGLAIQKRPGSLLALRGLAPGNQTRIALPLLLTPADVQNRAKFLHTFGLPSVLRGCGYQVFWLSNQELVSPYTAGAYSMGEEADILRFTADLIHDVAGEKPYDENLLTLVSPQEIQQGQLQAFFFHLAGSHIDYNSKYPPRNALYPSPRTVEESYINTIYYTDQVLEKIIDLILPKSKRLLFVYVSDHGEVVSQQKYGHGFSPAFQDEYRVPLVIWSSSPLSLSLKQMAETFQERSGGYNTEYFDNLIKYILGIESSLPGYLSPQVIALDHVQNYYTLRYFRTPESPYAPLLIFP